MATTDDSTKAQNACTMRRLPSQVACRKATRPEIFTEVGGGAVCSESCKHGAAGGQGFLRDRLPYPVAYRKGRRYGTIVVDLARGCPVDLLEDRLAETVAAWLRAHPEVTVVARDRADAYAAGVTQGAPDAVQVADRWHLLKNLREAVEVELCQRPSLPWAPPLPEADPAPARTPDMPTSAAPSALHTPDAPEAPP